MTASKTCTLEPSCRTKLEKLGSDNFGDIVAHHTPARWERQAASQWGFLGSSHQPSGSRAQWQGHCRQALRSPVAQEHGRQDVEYPRREHYQLRTSSPIGQLSWWVFREQWLGIKLSRSPLSLPPCDPQRCLWRQKLPWWAKRQNGDVLNKQNQRHEVWQKNCATTILEGKNLSGKYNICQKCWILLVGTMLLRQLLYYLI